MAPPAEDPPATPATLAQRLREGEEAEARVEAVDELWQLGTPEAVETLRQHFFVERDPDVRIDILNGLSEARDPRTRESCLGLLSAGLGPGQPSEVRLVAISLGTDFEDKRATALLQNMLLDPSEEIREAAREALEARNDQATDR